MNLKLFKNKKLIYNIYRMRVKDLKLSDFINIGFKTRKEGYSVAKKLKSDYSESKKSYLKRLKNERIKIKKNKVLIKKLEKALKKDKKHEEDEEKLNDEYKKLIDEITETEMIKKLEKALKDEEDQEKLNEEYEKLIEELEEQDKKELRRAVFNTVKYSYNDLSKMGKTEVGYNFFTVTKNTLNSDEVRYFNENYIDICDTVMEDVDKSYEVINAKIGIVYVLQPEGDKTVGNVYDSGLNSDDILSIFDDNEPRYATFPYIIGKGFTKNIGKDDVTREKVMIDNSNWGSGSRMLYIIRSFEVYTFDQNHPDDYISRIRAHFPIPNKKYHKATQCSTTKKRMCIYETYYYNYIDDSKIIAKNQNKLKEFFEKESDEVKGYVNRGELLNFLQYKVVETGRSYIVRWFESEMGNRGILVDKNGVSKITKYADMVGEKTFLYHKGHVAPGIVFFKKYDDDDEKVKIPKPLETIEYSLSPSKLKEIKNKIKYVAGFDFETRSDSDGKQIVYLASISDGKNENGDIKSRKKNFYYKVGDPDICDQLCDYFDSIKTDVHTSKSNKKESVKQILFYGFNNSNFDNLLMLEKLLKRCPGLKYVIKGTSVKFIKYYNILIFDIMNYYVGSLKDVSKSFGLTMCKGIFPHKFVTEKTLNYVGPIPKKGFWNNTLDYKKYKRDTGNAVFNLETVATEYCEKDAILARDIALKHLESCKGELNGRYYDVRLCATGAKIAQKMFTQVFLDRKLVGSDSESQTRERSAYKGGRTEVFKKYGKNLYYIDRNSSYPASMLKKMPIFFKHRILVDNVKVTKKDLTETNLYRATVKYIGQDKHFIPNILNRSSKGDITATRDSIPNGYHWGCELIEAIKNNCEVHISEINVYETGEIFKDYAEYFYSERLKIKTQKPALANFFKLLLNSLYGKFGQKIVPQTLICTGSEDVTKIINDRHKKIVDVSEVGSFTVLKYQDRMRDKLSIGNLVRFSSYISALARCALSKMMRKIGHEHIYYCDTDSIVCDVKVDEKYMSQDKLGLWKLEHEVKEGVFLAPKVYAMRKLEDDDEKLIEEFKKMIDENSEKDQEMIDEMKEELKEKQYEKKFTLKAKGMPKTRLPEYDDFKKLENGEVESISIKFDMFERSLNSVHVNPTKRDLSVVYNKRIWNGNESYSYDTMSEWEKAKYGK